MKEELKEEYTREVKRMSDVTKVSELDLMTSNSFPCPFCRGMIYNKLRKEGFTLKDISDISGYAIATVYKTATHIERIVDGNTDVDRIRCINEKYMKISR